MMTWWQFRHCEVLSDGGARRWLCREHSLTKTAAWRTWHLRRSPREFKLADSQWEMNTPLPPTDLELVGNKLLGLFRLNTKTRYPCPRRVTRAQIGWCESDVKSDHSGQATPEVSLRPDGIHASFLHAQSLSTHLAQEEGSPGVFPSLYL